MDQTAFDSLKDALHKAMPEIFDAHIDAGRGPRDATVNAFSAILGCSPNELRKWFAKHARSKGSNLFFSHYPAFGKPGCEYLPPFEQISN